MTGDHPRAMRLEFRGADRAGVARAAVEAFASLLPIAPGAGAVHRLPLLVGGRTMQELLGALLADLAYLLEAEHFATHHVDRLVAGTSTIRASLIGTYRAGPPIAIALAEPSVTVRHENGDIVASTLITIDRRGRAHE